MPPASGILRHPVTNHLSSVVEVDDACTTGFRRRRCACHRGNRTLSLSGDALVGFSGFVAIGVGGAIGCWLRWGLGMMLNPLFPTLPLGTLAANLVGGLLMGCVMGLFDHFQTLAPELRLFVFTGFLGGLTTFSTFSAESATLLLRQQYLWFSGHVAVHVVGSLAMTVLGIFLTRSLLRH
jgi:fluoride exporter